MYARGMTTSTLDLEIAVLRAAVRASCSQREAADALGLTWEAMRARVWAGSIPAVHVGKAIRIPRSVVETLRDSSALLSRATELTADGGGDAG